MRITSSSIRRETLATLEKGLATMAEAQRRVASGLRVHRPSDDPVAAAGILRSGRQIRALEQYSRNIDAAGSRLRSEEQALDTVTNLLTRAKELAVGSLSGVSDADAFASAHAEVQQLLDVATEQANMRHGDGYLFGGATANLTPFAADGTVTAGAQPSGGHVVDIGGTTWLATNHDGQEAFIDTGVFDALTELSDALEAGDPTAIGASMNSLDDAFDGVQRLLADVGARTNRLEVAATNVEALDLNLQTLRSDLQDVEIEEAVSDLVGRQIAYQSALLATSKILSTTLTDYLR